MGGGGAAHERATPKILLVYISAVGILALMQQSLYATPAPSRLQAKIYRTGYFILKKNSISTDIAATRNLTEDYAREEAVRLMMLA